MKKPPNRYRYTLSIAVLLLFAGALASQVVASFYAYSPINWADRLLDVRPHSSLLYLLVTLVGLLLVALWAYVWNLNPLARRRNGFWVFLNGFLPSAYAALGLAIWDVSQGDASFVTQLLAPAVALVPPLALLMLERFAVLFFERLGRWAERCNWRSTALRAMRAQLRLRPENAGLRRRCALIHVQRDEFESGLAMLDVLGDVRRSGDLSLIRALEQAARAMGRSETAQQCLESIREIAPETRGIEERLLEDYLRTEKFEKALQLLDSGRLRKNFKRLLLRVRLNVRLGHFDRAFQLIDQVRQQEEPPFSLTVGMLEDLARRRPDHLGVKAELGLLLLNESLLARRHEGANLLEAVIQAQPDRVDLRRQLIAYYRDHDLIVKERHHVAWMVETRQPDSDTYLRYAGMLEKVHHAIRQGDTFTSCMVCVVKDVRLGRLMLAQDDLQTARQCLRQARLYGMDEAARGPIEHLRADLERAQQERTVAQMESELDEDHLDEAKRLELIEHYLGVERVEAVIEQCDLLLDLNPRLRPEIESRLERASQKTQASFRLRDYLSDLYLQQHRYDDALRLIRAMARQALSPDRVLEEGCLKILHRDPDHLGARLELAMLRREAEDWTGICELLAPYLRQEPAGLAPEDRALYVEAAYRVGDLEEAVRVGVPLADELAGEADYILMLIELLEQADEYELALRIFEKGRQANPQDRRLERLERRIRNNWCRRRLEVLAQAQSERALTAAEHFEKAELHRDVGDIRLAVAHFQRAAEHDELAKIALAEMAVSLVDQRLYELAEETLHPVELDRESVQRHPRLLDLMYHVARTLEKAREFDRAVKYYKRIFGVDASYADVVERLGRLA